MRQALIDGLRRRGTDVTTAAEAGMIERADEDHLAHAAASGRVLLSANVGDFYRIHTVWLAAERSHAGIVIAQQRRYSVGELLRRIANLMASHTAEAMVNRVEFLSAWG